MNKATTFLIIGVLLAVAVVLLPVADWLQSAVAWIDANRAVSWLVFIVMYVTATVLLLPGSLLTLAAGFVFGLGYGFAMVSFFDFFHDGLNLYIISHPFINHKPGLVEPCERHLHTNKYANAYVCVHVHMVQLCVLNYGIVLREVGMIS